MWRRGWDSNPRSLSESLVFKTSSLNHSDTSPSQVLLFKLVTHRRFELRTPWLKVKCSADWANGSKYQNGEPTGIRTPDTRLRRPLLYPTELWARKSGAGDENRTHAISLEGWGSTIELHPHKLERKTRFELATLALARRCSTPEPLPHIRLIKLVEGGGFEPPKAKLTDLQSAPFGHSGNPRNSNLSVKLS